MNVIQSDMTSGELSGDTQARIDSKIYYNGLRKAQNVLIMPHGGIRRRPGLTKVNDSLVEDGRLFTFEFSSVQDYLIMFIANKILIFKDGVKQAEIPTTYTLEQIDTIDFIQSGDVCIISDVNHKPQMLRRTGSDTSWELTPAPLSGIPQFDFGQGPEDVWSDTRGWPGVATFFQSRLWFAGSLSNPNSVWGSKINSYYDFDIGTGQPDFGVFDTIDTEQFNRIINLYSGRNLQVFTTGSEFYNTADFITSETSSWKRSTAYGSRRVKPISIDGATLFVDKVGRTIRSSVFEFQEDAYIAPSVSVLSEHLIKNVQRMDAVKGTNIDISDFLFVVNADGTLAVMNSARTTNINGWTQWSTEGYFRDVCVVNKIIYFLVERHGEYHIEFLNEGTTTDHNTVHKGENQQNQNVIKDTTNVIHRDQNVIMRIEGTGQSITEIDTNETPVQASYNHVLVLDGSIQEKTKGGLITFKRPAYHVEVGFDVPLEVQSMPISVDNQQGETRTRLKRIRKVNLIVKDTLGVQVDTNSSPDRKFTVVLDEAPEPFSGVKTINLLGYSKETIINVNQENPLPFKLLGLGFEIV